MSMISIIVPCYNSAAFVARTLDSVRAQTLADWECVIVDDGSTDLSAEVVAAHIAGEPRMKLVRQPNGGVCNARNNGFKACSAHSKYLLFLDADDLLEPTTLEEMARYLDERPGVAMAHCAFVRIDERDEVCQRPPGVPRLAPRYRNGWGVRRLSERSAETPFAAIFATALVLPSGSVLRRSVYERTSGWDEEVGQHGEERDLFLRIALLGPVHYVPRPFLKYRVHESQSTSVRSGDGVDYSARWYNKWRRLPLSGAQRARYREGWLFFEASAIPFARLEAGRRCLRERRLGQALRHFAWAAARCARVRLLCARPL